MKLQGGVKKQMRRQSALNRLRTQLEKGTKSVSEFSGSNPVPIQRQYPLIKKDIERIKKEIKILESRT